MKKLRPAFEKEGSITAGNASTINDGAAAIVLGGEEYRGQAKFKIIAYAQHAQTNLVYYGANRCNEKMSKKSGLSFDDIDLFEINEAFAVVTMAQLRSLI